MTFKVTFFELASVLQAHKKHVLKSQAHKNKQTPILQFCEERNKLNKYGCLNFSSCSSILIFKPIKFDQLTCSVWSIFCERSAFLSSGNES